MASVVLLVTFPENPDLRQRSIVVRAEGATAAEVVSKIMSKSGLTGVGFLTAQVGKEPERPLAPKEDVFALASQAPSAKDVVLAFRSARVGEEPPRRPLPALAGIGAAGGGGGGAATGDWGAAGGALAERVAEQEKLIAQLKQIEREQQRIIDAQLRGEVLSPRAAAAGPGPSLGAALERDRLEMALEEERRQNAYNRRELERLRAQKVCIVASLLRSVLIPL
jgi:hypothetical protein